MHCSIIATKLHVSVYPIDVFFSQTDARENSVGSLSTVAFVNCFSIDCSRNSIITVCPRSQNAYLGILRTEIFSLLLRWIILHRNDSFSRKIFAKYTLHLRLLVRESRRSLDIHFDMYSRCKMQLQRIIHNNIDVWILFRVRTAVKD